MGEGGPRVADAQQIGRARCSGMPAGHSIYLVSRAPPVVIEPPV
ncbi:MAG: hypothetical protein R3A44_03945 [Caldilineaceae bacterium]